MYTLGELHQLLAAKTAGITIDQVVAQAVASNVNRTGNPGQVNEYTRVSHASAATIATALGVSGW